MTIGSEHDLVSAMKTLIRRGPKIVIVTSSEVSDFPGYLSCYAMVASSDDDTTVEISRVVISKIQGSNFTGTGDLSAALLLGWTDILERSTPEHRLRSNELGIALRNTLESVQAALRRTVVKTARMLKTGPVVASEHQHRAYRVKASELCLVESRFDIMTPPRALPALESSNGDVVSQWKASLQE
jgi:pyridoxal/pyridoxine/pyridoxamine kinase